MRALISVSDKTGIVDFAKELVSLGVEIISTGGTHKTLEDAGLPVIGISDVTGFPECLDGRVKTLHPNIHAGLLAIRANEEHMKQVKELNVELIDIVVVNLYPFKQTILKEGVEREEAIENIDIGGPTMLRSAAKNYQDVSVVVDPADYQVVLDELKANKKVSVETNFYLSSKVFEHTASYDALIANYMRKERGAKGYPEKLTLTFEKVQDMRYGENPHQRAKLYNDNFVNSFFSNYIQLNGKELSFNNLNDLNTAVELCAEFSADDDEFAAVALKHATPCGVAVGKTPAEAFRKAFEADRLSIFGGIVAMNGIVDAEAASIMKEIFLEVVAAPGFTEEALEILRIKKNLRILVIDFKASKSEFDMKYVSGKLLIQDSDQAPDEKFECVTGKNVTPHEKEDLLFAMKVCKYVKSNAIVIAKDKSTVAIGGGQTSRIWALDAAINNYSDKDLNGCVLASDAFFPFSDCVERAAEVGITSIIQPGGSIQDQLSIDECNKRNISMIFTGTRHFKH